jgi:hypothetical protein
MPHQPDTIHATNRSNTMQAARVIKTIFFILVPIQVSPPSHSASEQVTKSKGRPGGDLAQQSIPGRISMTARSARWRDAVWATARLQFGVTAGDKEVNYIVTFLGSLTGTLPRAGAGTAVLCCNANESSCDRRSHRISRVLESARHSLYMDGNN